MMKRIAVVLLVLVGATACSGGNEAPPEVLDEAPVSPIDQESSDPESTTPESTDTSDAADEPSTAPATPAPATPAPATPAPAAVDPATGATVYDSETFRNLMITGIANGSGVSEEVATCILNETLAAGLTMDDFVLRGGDEDVLAAISDATVICSPG